MNAAAGDVSAFSCVQSQCSLRSGSTPSPSLSDGFCLPLEDDVWGFRRSVPCLALPLVPFDVGHQENVGKGQAGHRGGYPKGHGVAGFAEVHPVPALFDLQSGPQAQLEHLAEAAECVSRELLNKQPFVFPLWAA